MPHQTDLPGTYPRARDYSQGELVAHTTEDFADLDESTVDLRPHQLLDLLNEQRRKNRELSHANEELRAFAYSVSHDLRTPIRGIDGFSRVLAEEYGGRLDSTALKYLEFIRDSSLRAGKIIDNLMRLSQISRSSVHYEEVDLGLLAKEVFQSLVRGHPIREITFRVEGEGRVSCDREFMQIALENLIGNSLKFTRQREKPELLFRIDTVSSVDEKEKEVIASLSDNGAGFSMDDVGKLFSPFQRLHSERDFQGFGVGLATVKRIIQKHSGRVWAHSSEGHGATFGFALPD